MTKGALKRWLNHVIQLTLETDNASKPHPKFQLCTCMDIMFIDFHLCLIILFYLLHIITISHIPDLLRKVWVKRCGSSTFSYLTKKRRSVFKRLHFWDRLQKSRFHQRFGRFTVDDRRKCIEKASHQCGRATWKPACLIVRLLTQSAAIQLNPQGNMVSVPWFGINTYISGSDGWT